MKIQNKLQKQKEILEEQGYNVAFVALYGSQNYKMDIHTEEYQSDVDMKAIIVPTLDDLVTNSKPISTTIATEWGECDLKDIREYFKIMLKANPSYIETIFTDYYVVDEQFKDDFDTIFELRDELVEVLAPQMIRAMYGMMCEKEKALCHPYPSIAHKIDKFGIDGKQSHHILRLYHMMQDYFTVCLTMKESLTPPKESIKNLMEHKLNILSLDDAKSEVKIAMFRARGLRDTYLNSVNEGKLNHSIRKEFIGLSHSIIKKRILNDSQKGV